MAVRAFDVENNEIYSSGVLSEPSQPVVALLDSDPDLRLFRAEALDIDGEEAHMFWDIAESRTDEERIIPGPKTIRPIAADGTVDPEFERENVTTFYSIPGQPHRITVRVRVRPMGLDVLQDLVDSGDLEERHLDAMPIHDALPNREREDVTVEWRAELQTDCVSSGPVREILTRPCRSRRFARAARRPLPCPAVPSTDHSLSVVAQKSRQHSHRETFCSPDRALNDRGM